MMSVGEGAETEDERIWARPGQRARVFLEVKGRYKALPKGFSFLFLTRPLSLCSATYAFSDSRGHVKCSQQYSYLECKQRCRFDLLKVRGAECRRGW